MIGSLYYVYSKNENNVDGFEGAFPTEESAKDHCRFLAATYGPTLKQDLDEGERIVSIFYRLEWQLK